MNKGVEVAHKCSNARNDLHRIVHFFAGHSHQMAVVFFRQHRQLTILCNPRMILKPIQRNRCKRNKITTTTDDISLCKNYNQNSIYNSSYTEPVNYMKIIQKQQQFCHLCHNIIVTIQSMLQILQETFKQSLIVRVIHIILFISYTLF